MGHDSVLITALANRGYEIAKIALLNHPPHVCVALLSRRLKHRHYTSRGTVSMVKECDLAAV